MGRSVWAMAAACVGRAGKRLRGARLGGIVGAGGTLEKNLNHSLWEGTNSVLRLLITLERGGWGSKCHNQHISTPCVDCPITVIKKQNLAFCHALTNIKLSNIALYFGFVANPLRPQHDNFFNYLK